jgi:PncC family amidohydrolase
MNQHPDLARIVNGLRDAGITVAFAESCTGGRLAADLTTIPGSSDVVRGSAVCYATETKRTVLGLKDVGESNVVSAATALQMAYAARRLFGADIGVGTTGYLDGDALRAHWVLVGPQIGNAVHVESSKIEFPEGTHRDMNREFVVREVMGALSMIVSLVR